MDDTTQLLLPLPSTNLSACCQAPMVHHRSSPAWPCYEQAQCTKCRVCAACGPSVDAYAGELQAVRETEAVQARIRKARRMRRW